LWVLWFRTFEVIDTRHWGPGNKRIGNYIPQTQITANCKKSKRGNPNLT
jgi:hypothetical protein